LVCIDLEELSIKRNVINEQHSR